jgi:hypothetical protein
MLSKQIDKNGIDVSVRETIYAKNESQFKDIVISFLNEPWGKVLSFDVELENYDSFEAEINPRGVEDGFDIRFDGDVVASHVYSDNVLKVMQEQIEYFIKNM